MTVQQYKDSRLFQRLLFASLIFAVAGTKCGAATPSQLSLVIQSKEAGEHKSFSGNVSWYGPGFQGKKTASGEIFDMHKLTAAHLTLPLGTRVLVEDPKTGKSVIVKVNDRGPYVHTRVMDLSKEGGRRIDLLTRGVVYTNCLIID